MNDGSAGIKAVAWTASAPPQRVLVIRLHAFGDIIAALPSVQSLRRLLPHARLDLLTRRDFIDVPRELRLFDRIHAIRGRRNYGLQRLFARLLLPRLKRERYDVVIDLQHSGVSDEVRRKLDPPAWSAFDRFSPLPHGERVRRTIVAAWPVELEQDYRLELRNPEAGCRLLPSDSRSRELVVLNPAGFFSTRNWPLERYIEFARLWLERRNPEARFVFLGLSRIADKAAEFERALPGVVINLVGKTSAAEALSILQQVAFVLSEDSGLLHMAWCSGRPNVALFGSTRSTWSKPMGNHSAYLDSSDLACGECMQEVCKFGDVHCLTRYSAAEIFALAENLLERLQNASAASCPVRMRV